MSKKIYEDKIDEVFDSNIDTITIEEIDKEIEDFYIDREKIDTINIPKNKNEIIRKAMDRAKTEIKSQKRKRYILGIASSISAILCIGIYSPALAHSIPPVEKALQNINDTLKIDEIASYTGIDKVFPRAVIDDSGKLKLEKPTSYKVQKSDKDVDESETLDGENNEENLNENSNTNIENLKDEKEYNVEAPLSEYSSVQLIHKMSNSIIKAVDDRKYGEIPITPFNINQAIEGLKYIQDEGASSYLYNSLLKWKEGDFNNAVLVHNFVWNMLDGEVGKAISINNESVTKIVNKHFN